VPKQGLHCEELFFPAKTVWWNDRDSHSEFLTNAVHFCW